jgi:hypothetical protein
MNAKNLIRHLTGAAKNAIVWGGAWFGLAFTAIIGLRTAGVVVPPEIGVLDAIGMAVRVGIVGVMTGGVFAAFISWFYRGRRLSEINWIGFGVGGAAVAELFILAWFGLGPLLSGDAFPPLGDIGSDLVMVAVFGFIAAGASMWLAQRAGTPSLEGPDRYDSLHAGSAPETQDAIHRPHVGARL